MTDQETRDIQAAIAEAEREIAFWEAVLLGEGDTNEKVAGSARLMIATFRHSVDCQRSMLEAGM